MFAEFIGGYKDSALPYGNVGSAGVVYLMYPGRVSIPGRTPSKNAGAGVGYSLSFHVSSPSSLIIPRMFHWKMCGGRFGATSVEKAVLTMLGLDDLTCERAQRRYHAWKHQKVRFSVPRGELRSHSVNRL